MSDPLRIALVAEGPTDRVVIEAGLRAMLADREFVLNQLQPEGSAVFGQTGSGWVGVCRWCRQSAQRGGGALRGDELLFQNHDLLVLHLDADVAGAQYQNGSLTPRPTEGALPCEEPCPPASATTNRLRTVLLTWCGEIAVPERTVICIPSKCTEAWVLAALFPDDGAVHQGIECFVHPESRFGQQRKARRIRKTQRDYIERAADLEGRWPLLTAPGALVEALRFQLDFLAALPPA